VVLKTIHPAGNLEDAFLKTLAEDRRRGFARAFENEGAIDQLGVRATPVIPEPAEPPPDKPSPDKDAQ
jgi:hypothetical protein